MVNSHTEERSDRSGIETRDAPNVALVVLDTARARETPPARRSVMPALAALGDDGTAFTNAFASAPWTLPSHASMFTGTYPSEHGAHGGHRRLEDDLRVLPEAFADAGYETVAGSNNTWITREFGFDRGFETFWKGWQYVQSGTDHGAVVRAKQPATKARAAADVILDGNPVVNAVNILYSEFGQPPGDDGAARTTERVESWLEGRDDDRPFFLFVNYIEPHIRYRPPEEYAERFLPADADVEEAFAVRQDPRAFNAGAYDLDERELELLRALYEGELAYVDDHLDRLRIALQEAGEWDDTIFVVVSDHGENLGDYGYLGHQYNVYDTLLHVPLVVHGGAFSREPAIVDDLVNLPDLAPTLLDAAGVDDPEFRDQCRGQSFHPDASGGRDRVFAEYISAQPPVESLLGQFGEVPDRLRAFDPPLRAVRTDEYKLVRDDGGRELLYDVATDPTERTDVTDAEPERVAELGRQLDDFLESIDRASATSEVTMTDATEARLADLGYL